MPLFEVVGTPPDIPKEKKVPIERIRELHENMTFRFECSLGTMYLRRLSLFDYEKTTIALDMEHPEYEKAKQDSAPLRAKMGAGVSLDAAEMEQLLETTKILAPFIREFYVSCFIEPKLKSAADLSHVLFEMIPEERQQLLDALHMLSNAAPDGKLETTALILSKAFGIKLFGDDMTVEKMPVEAAALLLNVLKDENKKAANG